MKRYILQDLKVWKDQDDRMPLLLRGARQVGKSYVIENFGKTEFENLVTINFEFQPELKSCFTTLDPHEIINNLHVLTGQPINPGRTLLFLDEIQECPNAILSLRYFKEKLPQLHVIGAGSLLEFTLNDEHFRMPVGRIQFLFLKPLSFKEFLTATGNQSLREYMENVHVKMQIPEAIHEKLIKFIHQYTILGGMPAVVQEYINQKNMSRCQQLQTALLQTYRNDFGKYAKHTDQKYIQRLFEKAPGLIGQHFKYIKVDPDMRSRDIKKALNMLADAGLIYPVFSSTASGIPLISLADEKKFKIFFLDIGLVKRATQLNAEILLHEDILLVNRGTLAEQLVAQELLAYSSKFEPGALYFWTRDKKGSMAEIDFLTTHHEDILPIEVKSGTTGRLKSLQIFMQEKNSKFGIHISQQPLLFAEKILSLPIYLLGELQRLIEEIL